MTFVDYDHDGDLDLYVSRVAGRSVTALSPTGLNAMWRNNGNGTFTDVTSDTGLAGSVPAVNAIGSDYNNDRAVDLVVTGADATIFENPREGVFRSVRPWVYDAKFSTNGVVALDFDHDGWMDYAFTGDGSLLLSLWRSDHGKTFNKVALPETNWARAYGIAAFDYDNDGWVDLVAVGETKDGKGEVRLFRNLGPDGFKDVTAEVGLDKIRLQAPRAVITGDFDNDGAVDLLITQNHAPAVLLRNEGGNKNNWLRLSLKGLNDNKIGDWYEGRSFCRRQPAEVRDLRGHPDIWGRTRRI